MSVPNLKLIRTAAARRAYGERNLPPQLMQSAAALARLTAQEYVDFVAGLVMLIGHERATSAEASLVNAGVPELIEAAKAASWKIGNDDGDGWGRNPLRDAIARTAPYLPTERTTG